MHTSETRFGLAVFAVLTAAVAGNLFLFQERRPGRDIETSALQTAGSLDQDAAARPAAPAAAHAANVLGKMSQQPKAGQGPVQSETALNKAEIIRGVQRELNTRGYGTGQPDGMAGLLTRAAIMAYEYDYGMGLTGEPTQELLSRIVLGTSGPAPQLKSLPPVKTAEAEAVVKTVKQYLANLGYAAGKADGKFTDEMVRALRDFELDQKLPETGRISAQAVSRLLRLQGQGHAAAQR